jgi:hypothetical protein
MVLLSESRPGICLLSEWTLSDPINGQLSSYVMQIFIKAKTLKEIYPLDVFIQDLIC